MSEIKSHIEAETRAYLHERESWIADAVRIVAGDPSIDPLIAFPEKSMHEENVARADAKGADLTLDQETQLREVAGRFGIGGNQDVPSGAEHQLEEGGKPWKVEAQLKNSISDNTKSIIMCGWPGRLLGDDEKQYLELRYGRVSSDEYQMVRQVVEAHPGFVADDSDEVLPFGYDIHNDNALVGEATGQLTQIGRIDNIPVLMLRIDNDWEMVFDEKTQTEKRAPRNRPDSAAVMQFVSFVLKACGDETSSIGFNTSNTYASRAIDTVRAGYELGRTFKVGMYGRETLKSTLAPNIPDATPLNQIPGELRIMHEKLQLLADAMRRGRSTSF